MVEQKQEADCLRREVDRFRRGNELHQVRYVLRAERGKRLEGLVEHKLVKLRVGIRIATEEQLCDGSEVERLAIVP